MSTALAVNGKPEGRSLTPLQQKLADLWLEATFAGLDIPQHELAKAAGYGGNSPEALRVIASKALNAPHVRAYLRQQARDRMDEGGIEALATLKRLTTGAKSERVRGDIAYKVAVGTGLLAPEGQAGGGSVVLQLVFRHSVDSVLSTPAQVIDAERDAPAAIPLAQGTGDGQSARRAPRPLPRGGSMAAPKAKAGGQKRPRSALAPPPHTIPPPKLAG